MKKLNMVLAGALALGMVACSSSDENLAAKDKVLQEKQDQIDTLQKQLAANESTRLVMQRQLDDANARASTARATNTTSSTTPTNPLIPDSERNVGTKSAKADTTAPTKKTTAKSAPKVADKSVSTFTKGDSTVFRLTGGFNAGSSTLTKEGEAALTKIAAELKKSKSPISIEGHTDTQPLTGKNKERYKNNTNLSLARANTVKEWLESHCKISDSRLSVTGYGDKKLIENGTTKEANAKNRRIDIVLDG